MSGFGNNLLNAQGDLKFKFLTEREIQIFGETDLVTKIACGVGKSLFGKTCTSSHAGVCGGGNEFHGGLSLDIFTIGKIVQKAIYTPLTIANLDRNQKWVHQKIRHNWPKQLKEHYYKRP